MRSEHDRHHGRLYRISEAGFDHLIGGYDWMLTRVLRFKLVTLAVTILSLVASLYVFNVIPKGFFPNEDTGLIFAATEAVQDISFDSMARINKRSPAIVQADPEVADVGSFIGASPFNPASTTAACSSRSRTATSARSRRPIGRGDSAAAPQSRASAGHPDLFPGDSESSMSAGA